jgi:hypothetical protein
MFHCLTFYVCCCQTLKTFNQLRLRHLYLAGFSALHCLLLLLLLQEDGNRRANQDKLGQLGLLPLLAKLGADAGGAPSAAVRAQVGFCICTKQLHST